jgi:Raf kinase inhibitor-like YbhB/YbcL family protein
MALELQSNAFEAGQTILTRFTCEGQNVSPPLSWRGVPDGTKTLALIFDDPDAPNGTFSHWVLYNIPVGVTELPENASENLPQGIMQGRNSYGNARYDGPCPPHGSEHQYYFRLFAVDEQIDMTAGATRAQILDHMQKHGLENTELLVRFGRAPAAQST